VGDFMRIAELRKFRKLTQDDVARLSGLKMSTYQVFERYKNEPSVLKAIKIAKILDVPVEEIFKEEYYKDRRTKDDR